MKEFFRKITGQKKKKRRRRRSSEDKPADPEKEDTRRLQRRLEDNAQTVSLRRLKKYGLQSVRVIDANSIRDIVNDAVDEALRHRGATLSPNERVAVQDHAKARIMELLQENQRLTDEKSQLEQARTEYETQQHELEDQLDTLRSELDQRRAELERELMAARQMASGMGSGVGSNVGDSAVQVMTQVIRKEISFSEETFVDLEGRVQRLFERLVREGALEDADEVGKSLRDTIERVIANVRQEEGAVEGGLRTEKIEMLEKRISKLNNALEAKEQQLKQLALAKMADTGLASIYEGIQGLDYEDPDYERKTELLSEVFKQNLELQEFMGVAPKEAEPEPEPEPAAAMTPATPPGAQTTESGLVVPEGFAKPTEVDFGEMAF